MKVSFALVVLAGAALVLSAHAAENPCNSNAGARNTTEINSCVSHISHEPFSDDKLDALGACIKQSDRGFTGQQTVQVRARRLVSQLSGEFVALAVV